MDTKLQSYLLTKFQVLVLGSKIDLLAKIENRSAPNSYLFFLPNLPSRPENSNSALSTWSESSFLNFSSIKILILYQVDHQAKQGHGGYELRDVEELNMIIKNFTKCIEFSTQMRKNFMHGDQKMKFGKLKM